MRSQHSIAGCVLGRSRPVMHLSPRNTDVQVMKFKMEVKTLVLASIRKGGHHVLSGFKGCLLPNSSPSEFKAIASLQPEGNGLPNSRLYAFGFSTVPQVFYCVHFDLDLGSSMEHLLTLLPG